MGKRKYSRDKLMTNYFLSLCIPLFIRVSKYYTIDCCNWILSSDRELVGGRNFSSVFDPWESDDIEKIKDNPNNFKLRRFGNEIFKENE